MVDKKNTYTELKKELDTLLESMQRDDSNVDEALKLYERGMELVKLLEATLKEAENKIVKIKAKFDV